MSGFLEYSTTPGSNTAINSIGIAGSDAVQNFDNGFRQLMADAAAQITRRVAKSTAYTVLKTDHKALIECTAALTLSMTAAATLTNGFMCIVKANGGAVTIDPASSEQIDGATTKTVPDGSFAFVYCNGSAFFTISLPTVLDDIAALTPTDGSAIVGDGSTWTTLALGTAAEVDTGTSGTTIPLLDGANTWDADQTISPTSGGANLSLVSQNASLDAVVVLETADGNDWSIRNDDEASSNNFVIRYNGSQYLAISSANGDATFVADITAFSDASMKPDFEPFTYDEAVDIVKSLKKSCGRWTDIHSGNRRIGSIANDFERLAPELVKFNEDGIRSLAYGNSTAILFSAVNAIIEKLEM